MPFPLTFGSNRPKRRATGGRTPEEIKEECEEWRIKDKFYFPPQAEIWYPGETYQISWYGGPVIEAGRSTFTMQLAWYRYGEEKDGVQQPAIFTNKTSKYPSSEWKELRARCNDTFYKIYWTVLEDLVVGDTQFAIKLYNVTGPENTGYEKSSLFFIYPNDDATSTEDIASTPTSTAESQETTTDSTGLSTGSKAGIGVGIGALALVLLLAGFFFYRRKKRQTPATAAPGFEKPQLDGKMVTIAEVDGSGVSAHEVPDSAIHEAPDKSFHEGPFEMEQPRKVHRINQEPVEMPADSPMSSPKTSQDRLNKT
ncbi:hypothetical protein FBEOM_2029 [Fusarium beomiforme]|uniref:Uncharacterized protein n=1 Tax=Fusarium beomiforme TaxID=44412 RepID=A0A9P5AS70_9HYPO|nr:hypothetical protein FBEOM_2029 [Fusarium beomiforme]